MRTERPSPKIIRTRNFKSFNLADFVRDIEVAPWSVCSTFHNPVDSNWAWKKILTNICDEHALCRDKKLRKQSLPWINANIRYKMNLRLETLRKARQTNDDETWAKCKEVRNQVTSEVRAAICEYYKQLFDNVRNPGFVQL